jgi:hypothetical protein
MLTRAEKQEASDYGTMAMLDINDVEVKVVTPAGD